MKPIYITMGDPNGVGPEICVQLLHHLPPVLREKLIVIGCGKILQKATELFGFELDCRSADQAQPGAALFLDPLTGIDFAHQPGQVCSVAGQMSIEYVRRAVLDIQSGLAAAMVTAPLCKESVEHTVPGFQGHTEYIGEMCGDPHPVLALIHGDWVVAHVSTHVSLRQACELVTEQRILKVGTLLNQLLRSLKPDRQPLIGVAGLNPHAGENGLFGSEEIEIIAPAVAQLNALGIQARGPLPADVVFPMLKAKRVDGVLAMYHDQGHVVTKTLAFDLGENAKLEGVNITLGIDVLRTSVDHGTGFDLAWQGKANAQSLLDALDVAMRMSWGQSIGDYAVPAL